MIASNVNGKCAPFQRRLEAGAHLLHQFQWRKIGAPGIPKTLIGGPRKIPPSAESDVRDDAVLVKVPERLPHASRFSKGRNYYFRIAKMLRLAFVPPPKKNAVIIPPQLSRS